MPTSPTSCRTRILSKLREAGKLSIVSTPFSNGIQYVGMNVKNPPFDNPKVRQAVAYAIPYQKIMDAVQYGLAKPMFALPPTSRPRSPGRSSTSSTPTSRKPSS